MEFIARNFKSDIISEMLSRELKDTHNGHKYQNIAYIAKFNRLDLLQILYQTTDEFTGITCVVDLASRYGNLEVVEYLIRMGAQCTCEAIDWSARNGLLEIVKFLAFQNCSCDRGLYFATINGHLEIVKFLYEHELGLKRLKDAVSCASRSGYTDILAILK